MGRPRRDEGPALSLESLMAAVLRLAETEGEAAINMRRVAEALGVSSRLLYRHVKHKAELLDLLADTITTRIVLPPADRPWDERLLITSRNARREVRRYPGVSYRALINSTQNLGSPHVSDITRFIHTALADAGLDDTQVRDAYAALSVLTWGHQMVAEAYASGAENPARLIYDAADLEAGFENGLRMLLDGIAALGRRNREATSAR